MLALQRLRLESMEDEAFVFNSGQHSDGEEEQKEEEEEVAYSPTSKRDSNLYMLADDLFWLRKVAHKDQDVPEFGELQTLVQEDIERQEEEEEEEKETILREQSMYGVADDLFWLRKVAHKDVSELQNQVQQDIARFEKQEEEAFTVVHPLDLDQKVTTTTTTTTTTAITPKKDMQNNLYMAADDLFWLRQVARKDVSQLQSKVLEDIQIQEEKQREEAAWTVNNYWVMDDLFWLRTVAQKDVSHLTSLAQQSIAEEDQRQQATRSLAKNPYMLWNDLTWLSTVAKKDVTLEMNICRVRMELAEKLPNVYFCPDNDA